MQKRPARADSPDHFYVNPILGTVSGVLLAIGSMTVLLIAGWFYAGTSNQGGGSTPGTTDQFRPEVVLPLLVVAGVIAFLLALLACVAFLAVFRLTDYKQALGLPDGSIRAVLALGLVLIFAIVSIYLYGSTANVRRDTATNLPAEALPALAPGTVLNIVAHPASAAPGASGPPVLLYDVTTRASGTETSDNLARQLITLIGTLVAALTAFYFGTRSAETAGVTAGAAVAAQAMGGPAREVRITEPAGDVDLAGAAGTALAITFAVVPIDSAVVAAIDGDADGTIDREAPTRFTYKRGSNPADRVVISVTQTADSSAVARITVRKV